MVPPIGPWISSNCCGYTAISASRTTLMPTTVAQAARHQLIALKLNRRLKSCIIVTQQRMASDTLAIDEQAEAIQR